MDLATGRFFLRKTDLLLPGRLPLTIEPYHRAADIQAGVFGLGGHLASYDHRLFVEGVTLTLVQGDRNGFAFVPVGAGGWENRTEPALRGAVVTQLAPLTFQMRLKDGTLHRFEPLAGFPNVAALAAITDRNGNSLTISREPEVVGGFFTGLSRIARITEPGRRAITFSDALGSVLALADPTGALPTTYTYDPFGRTTLGGIPSPNPFRYSGREHDGMGLYHYRERYYHPWLQRFVSEDRIPLAGGDVNRYSCVWNNPVNLSDPLGLAGVRNMTNRPISASGNPGGFWDFRGTGEQVHFTIQPGQTVDIWNPTSEGVRDVDFVEGIQIRGTSFAPNVDIIADPRYHGPAAPILIVPRDPWNNPPPTGPAGPGGGPGGSGGGGRIDCRKC